MTEIKKTRRLSFDIPIELHDRLTEHVTYGNMSRLMPKVCEILVRRLEEGGVMMVAAIIHGDYDPLFIREEDKNGKAT